MTHILVHSWRQKTQKLVEQEPSTQLAQDINTGLSMIVKENLKLLMFV